MNNIKYNIMRGKLQHFFFLYAAVFFFLCQMHFSLFSLLSFFAALTTALNNKRSLSSQKRTSRMKISVVFFFVDGCNFRRCARFIVRKIMWNRGVNKENGNVFTFR